MLIPWGQLVENPVVLGRASWVTAEVSGGGGGSPRGGHLDGDHCESPGVIEEITGGHRESLGIDGVIWGTPKGFTGGQRWGSQRGGSSKGSPSGHRMWVGDRRSYREQ